ncbi:hypothetical protein BDW74DRAFT_142164 [Aspergillus multicolor]|uniref:uncharacterized protein n=1 Tax=Aspergillus multicolor TaxID=41759 RepID=UPI003CCCE6A5
MRLFRVGVTYRIAHRCIAVQGIREKLVILLLCAIFKVQDGIYMPCKLRWLQSGSNQQMMSQVC